MPDSGWPRRIVILNFTGMRENWGCQATSWELAGLLRRAFSKKGAAPRLDMVPLPPRHLIDHLIERRHGGRIERILSSPRPSADDLAFLERLARRRFRAFVDVVEAADLVVFQGEGTLGRREFTRGVRLLALPFLARMKWKKPVIALNLSAFAVADQAVPLLANVLGSFDVLAVREPASLAFCRDIGLEHALLCPDMAFLTRHDGPPPAAAGTGGRGYFCVSGSAALGLYPLRRYVRLIEDLAVDLNLEPVILYAKRKDSWIRDAARALWRRARAQTASRKSHPSYRDLLPLLAGAKFIIGGRYHISILASAAGTPPILLPGNSHKTEGLARLIGRDVCVHDLADEMAVRREAARLAAGSAEGRERLLEAVGGLRGRIALFADFLDEASPLLAAGDAAGVGRLAAEPRYAALAPVAPGGQAAAHARLYHLANAPRRCRLAPAAGPVVWRPRPRRLLDLLQALHRGLSLAANLRRYACRPA